MEISHEATILGSIINLLLKLATTYLSNQLMSSGKGARVSAKPMVVGGIGGCGLSPIGKLFRFVSIVRACARSGCHVLFELKTGCRPFSFFFLFRRAFPFHPPHSQASYPTSVGYISNGIPAWKFLAFLANGSRQAKSSSNVK